MTTDERPTLRLTLLTVLVAGMLLALLSRLWFLQVLAGERYAELADSNRVRFVVLDAPRGRILAQDGQELVKNRPAQTVSAHPRDLLDLRGEPLDEDAARVLDRLSVLLDLEQDRIVERLLSRKYSPFRPVPVAEDVPREVILAVNEHKELFRGVEAETLPVRTYPHGTMAAHLVGYLGEINETELTEVEYAGYRPGDLIGWAGLERTYESDLNGQEGLRKLEVNAKGDVLRVFEERPPVRGNDLVTSLDLELQGEVERILEEGIIASREIERKDGRFLPSVAGAAVVLDPRDGSVRAMASYPVFDPSQFVGGVTQGYWDFLRDAANEYPLLNRAVQSAYPPGSVFKIVSGSAALLGGLITTESRISCPPAWRLGNLTFRNWSPRHEGSMDLTRALKRSCDTFFYELARQEWSREEAQPDDQVDETLPRVAAEFGLGARLGVDLPSESPGVIPSREWRKTYWEQHKDTYCRKAEELTPGSYAQRVNADLCRDGGRWRGGDAVNRSIGQGDVLLTPLQVAATYMAIANGGTVYAPQVGERIVDFDGTVIREIEPEVVSTLSLTPAQMAEIRRGLEAVVMDRTFPSGTGSSAFRDFPIETIPVAGKTGTAELRPKVPYAWFASYAPANDPQYVVVVAVEQGGGGSQTAAPIVRSIYDAIFDLGDTEFEEGPRTD
ncbi:MAG TPA: penicillin-binding protein 2 [Nitriliruptorales bacterium]